MAVHLKDFQQYANVVGIDIDNDGIPINTVGVKYNHQTSELKKLGGDVIPPEQIVDPVHDDKVMLPASGGYMKMPVGIHLKGFPDNEPADGAKKARDHNVEWLPILDEKHRKTQDMYDGTPKEHEYTKSYERIAKAAADYGKLAESDKPDSVKLEQAKSKLQGQVDNLQNRIVQDKLGGYGGSNKKNSILKRRVLGAQVPDSATSIVTNDATLPMDTLKVSHEIYQQMKLDKPDDKVLLWRDPALTTGSLRSFNIEEDQTGKLTGVAINPLVSDSFGMDFDGDTVGLWAPKSAEAKRDMNEKANVGNHLLAPDGSVGLNISQDFVAAAVKLGVVGPSKSKNSPLYGHDKDNVTLSDSDKGQPLSALSNKDQLKALIRQYAAQPDSLQKVDQLWHDTVTSEQNVGMSYIDPTNRETFENSMLDQVQTGAKGKAKMVSTPNDQRRVENGMSFAEAKFKGLVDPHSSNMAYYDRAKEIYAVYDSVADRLPDDPKRPDMTHEDKVNEVRKQLHRGDFSSLDHKEQLILCNLNDTNAGGLMKDNMDVRSSIAAKVDKTGQAGKASQMLAGLAYENPEFLNAALEQTEPLTDAVISLKHDPEDVPKVEEGLNDWNRLLRGQYPDRKQQEKHPLNETEFVQNAQDVYNKMGINVDERFTKTCFKLLADDNGKMMPINDAVKQRESPLQQMGMNGFDTVREFAMENTKELHRTYAYAANGKQYDPKVRGFHEGVTSKFHTPKNISPERYDAVKSMQKAGEMRAYKRSLQKHRPEIEQFKQRQVQKAKTATATRQNKASAKTTKSDKAPVELEA